MDQQLDAVVAGNAHSVQGGGDLSHSAVKGGVHGVAGGLNAAAGAQNALCKGLVRDVGLCQHLALQRGQHGLALVGELSGVFVLGLAAKKLVKKTHKYHSFLSSCKGGKGNKMFADPEWFTCIKDTISRTKMQETRGLFLRDFFSMLSWQRILPFCRGLPRKVTSRR